MPPTQSLGLPTALDATKLEHRNHDLPEAEGQQKYSNRTNFGRRFAIWRQDIPILLRIFCEAAFFVILAIVSVSLAIGLIGAVGAMYGAIPVAVGSAVLRRVRIARLGINSKPPIIAVGTLGGCTALVTILVPLNVYVRYKDATRGRLMDSDDLPIRPWFAWNLGVLLFGILTGILGYPLLRVFNIDSGGANIQWTITTATVGILVVFPMYALVFLITMCGTFSPCFRILSAPLEIAWEEIRDRSSAHWSKRKSPPWHSTGSVIDTSNTAPPERGFEM